MSHYGADNSGPRPEIVDLGDRVRIGPYRGRVSVPRRDPRGDEQHCVWVEWDDGTGNYERPSNLIVED